MARKLFRREGGGFLPPPSTRVLPLPDDGLIVDSYPEAGLGGMGRSPMESPGPRQRAGSLQISPGGRRRLLWPTVTPLRERGGSLPTKRLYADPRALVCVRRKQRREVLFATRRNGRNGSGKSYRRTYYSQWSC